ncbi:MAG: DUF192 domain-containing protein [Flavobacteriaceae bacterium]|jgi:hypothetical protein|uniref:DUF192 domain-containing protein n=1 Tax=Flagellimonas TaxID=444459 RepID=UPI000E232D21|nr:DUF192 domain-containing protein [Allomuricauda sp.]MCR9264522.1 DUF192 domain-containing protein [Flavobacteriaceae bacterium]
MRYLPIVFFFLIVVSCKTENKKEIKTATIEFKKEGELSILQRETDSLLVHFDIEIADTDYETQTGLMYRESMEQNQGMLFIFPDVAMHYFYMKNTEIPLDIIYIDDALKIASFQKNARPNDETSLSSEVPIKYVLEVNAGLSDKLGLQVGDSISFTKK